MVHSLSDLCVETEGWRRWAREKKKLYLIGVVPDSPSRRLSKSSNATYALRSGKGLDEGNQNDKGNGSDAQTTDIGDDGKARS